MTKQKPLAARATARFFSNSNAFAALKNDGSIAVWRSPSDGGDQAKAPKGTGYSQIFSNASSNGGAFAALKNDGSIAIWGNKLYGGDQAEAPKGTGYSQIFSNAGDFGLAFAALKNDGSIAVWGNQFYGGYQAKAPSGTGYSQIFPNGGAFAALKNDGSIAVWGWEKYGGNQAEAPRGSGYSQIFSNGAFAALKNDGSIAVWGDVNYGGDQAKAPSGTGFASIQSTSDFVPLTFGPTATIASSLSRVGVNQMAQINVELSAASTNFTAADLSATNGSLSGFAAVPGSNGKQYTALFTPAANTKAEALITIAAGSFSEASDSSKTNVSATNFSLLVDTTPPSPTNLALANQARELVLVFSQQLGNGQAGAPALPALSAFSVQADGNPVAISSLAVNGANLSLSLAAPIADSVKQLSLTYTDPSAGDDAVALQDLAGQDAAGFTQVLSNQAPQLT